MTRVHKMIDAGQDVLHDIRKRDALTRLTGGRDPQEELDTAAIMRRVGFSETEILDELGADQDVSEETAPGQPAEYAVGRRI